MQSPQIQKDFSQLVSQNLVVKTPYLIVGSGRVARAFKDFFGFKRIPYLAWSRGSSESLLELSQKVQKVLLLVSDVAFESVFEQYPFLKNFPVAHASGSRVFLETFDFHPLMTFGEEPLRPEVFEKITFVGTPSEKKFREFFSEWNAPYLQISRSDKILYHALCATGVSTIAVVFCRLLEEWKKLGIQNVHVRPFLEQAVENVLKNPSAALTGPLQRQDQMLIQKHLKILPCDLQKLYELLGQMHLKKSLRKEKNED